MHEIMMTMDCPNSTSSCMHGSVEWNNRYAIRRSCEVDFISKVVKDGGGWIDKGIVAVMKMGKLRTM